MRLLRFTTILFFVTMVTAKFGIAQSGLFNLEASMGGSYVSLGQWDLTEKMLQKHPDLRFEKNEITPAFEFGVSVRLLQSNYIVVSAGYTKPNVFRRYTILTDDLDVKEAYRDTYSLIPISAKYRRSFKIFGPASAVFVEAGPLLLFSNHKQRVRFEYFHDRLDFDPGSFEDQDSDRSWGFESSIGSAYRLNSRVSVFSKVTYRYSPNSESADGPITIKYSGVEAKIGFLLTAINPE